MLDRGDLILSGNRSLGANVNEVLGGFEGKEEFAWKGMYIDLDIDKWTAKDGSTGVMYAIRKPSSSQLPPEAEDVHPHQRVMEDDMGIPF
jgi:hypothetical protein